MSGASTRNWRLLVILGVISSAAALLAMVIVFSRMGPGEPIAAVDVTPGQSFAVDWVADGYPKRAWLDFDCFGCSFPFRGSAQTSLNGAPVAAASIEVWTEQGYAVSSFSGGGEEEMHGKLLFDLPALPTGARVRTTGLLLVPSPRVVWASDGDLTPTPPRFTLLRFWIAP